jgi:hypothetical protein
VSACVKCRRSAEDVVTRQSEAVAASTGVVTATIGASRDVSIFQNNVNNSSGGGNALIAGTNAQGSPRRALIAFDVAGSIPAGAVIQSVQLDLVLGAVAGGGGGGGPANMTIGLHKLLANWGEGIAQQQSPPNDILGGMGQGVSATNGDATWNSNFHGASLWSAAGGDFAPDASATAVVGTALGAATSWLSSVRLLSDVQGWLDEPSANLGWILVNADETTDNTSRTFYSRQVATAAFHPQLTITYACPTTVAIGASRDATIFENNVANGSGGGNALFAGTNGAQNSPRRAPIAFDVAANVPAGAIVQQAQLTLFLGQFPNVGAVATSTIGIHRLEANWGEGATQQQNPPNDTIGGTGQGAPAADGDVTWNARFFSATTPTPWTTPGGDFAMSASASTVVSRLLNTGYSWDSAPSMVSDVQGWLDNAATNFGWMLVNADETSPATFRAFYSRHVATVSLRPLLSITYVLVDEASHPNSRFGDVHRDEAR